jgi:hypothetical protein
MKARATSLAAPSGVLCPVGKPSGATFVFGFATAVENRESNNGAMRASFLQQAIVEA